MNAVLLLVATGVTNRAQRDRPIDTDRWWYWAYRTWMRQTYTYRETQIEHGIGPTNVMQ